MDRLLLAVLKDRSKFRQLRGAVPDDLVGQETISMLAWYQAYFQAFPDRDKVDTESLRSLFNLRVGSTIDENQRAIMGMLFRKLDEPVDQHEVEGITEQLYDRDYKGRVAALVNRYDNGDEVDLTHELSRLTHENMRRKSASSPASYIDDPIADILNDFQGDRGLKLPTNVLKESVGGLQGGDTVAIAARPDKGKSSLLAAMLTGFAPQLEGLDWGGRPMLYLNNEGSGRRIIPRIYQAALGITFQEMVDKSNAGTLVDEYNKAMHGQRILVKDVHGSSLGQLEQVIEELKPCVVVFDMLANVRGGSIAGGNKTDALELVWQAVREMAVLHDFVALNTIQISADGDDQLYPPYGALKDSKTSVQGAVDVILMMGALNSIEMDSVRGFSTPKNKRQMMGKPSNIQSQVFFDKERARFEDGST
ncbi:DNA helicase [Pectobacterium phage Zenivior_B1]|uniref:DNA helicase n=2 Tax=Phimunavirus zenivior TaxID=2733345 RepID=A0A3G8FM44_9CAUD|nr:DNA helicase [Pectobacterium phage Zenivior]AZF94989.1 DNA helicase [Pectobacterium phage Zenivior]AZF95052.1 DNA helicase [Pectobacterium phage Zenivior_B1]